MPCLLLPFDLLLHYYRFQDTGLYLVDSTKLAVCHKARISGNGVFRGLAQGGVPPWAGSLASSATFPYTTRGQTVAFKITGGNIDDRQPLALERITAALRGKGFGDRGSHCQSPMKRRCQRGLHLLTGIGRTMKDHLFPLLGKLLPRKQSSIETLFAKLKSGMGWSTAATALPAMPSSISSSSSCLAAYSLAQTKGNITTVHIPGLASTYPQLGLH